MKIKYDELIENARRETWKHFISTARTTKEHSTVNNHELQELTKLKVNNQDVRHGSLALNFRSQLILDQKNHHYCRCLCHL